MVDIVTLYHKSSVTALAEVSVLARVLAFVCRQTRAGRERFRTLATSECFVSPRYGLKSTVTQWYRDGLRMELCHMGLELIYRNMDTASGACDE